MKFWYNRNKQEVNIEENIIKYKYFIMMNLNLEELEKNLVAIPLTLDDRSRLKKLFNKIYEKILTN